MLGIETNDIIILKEPYRIFQAFWILCGFRLLQVLITMIIYEIKYYKNSGEDYLLYGKRYVLRLRIIQDRYYVSQLKKYFHAK
jgi:hypothetical protein